MGKKSSACIFHREQRKKSRQEAICPENTTRKSSSASSYKQKAVDNASAEECRHVTIAHLFLTRAGEESAWNSHLSSARW